MIHNVTANHPSFRAVQFKTGLNVVLAERKESSTQKDTRNGLGKSTLIDIIDFCLGSRIRSGYGLAIEPLRDWTFTLECSVAGDRMKVSRAVADPGQMVIEGKTKDPGNLFGETVLDVRQWHTRLAEAMFGVSPAPGEFSRHPSFRSLISYFVRRGNDAYLDPFTHFRGQSTMDRQLHVAFLLGMNWENAAKWQNLRDQEKGIKALNDAMKTGVITSARGTVGELEAESIQLENQLTRESKALEEFKVHPQYESIQNEANSITARIHALANENIVDRRRLAKYKESVSAEIPPSGGVVDELYRESGVVFSESVRRTLGEAREFHAKIVENRRAFLGEEIKRLETRIEGRDADVRRQTEERARLIDILQTHGALHEMVKLQERVVELRARHEKVRNWIADLKEMASRKRSVRIERAELAKAAEWDHEQRRELWGAAVGFFGDNSQALYRTAGRLVIDVGESGFKYDVEIDKSGSEGVGKMKIFCFDLMLLQLMAQKGSGLIDFLVHDSGIYDGVDSRQRALAIELASAVAESTGTQYICALNSDMVPRDDFSSEFSFDDHVVLTLGDENPEDSLLGFRFEQPGKQT